MLWVRWGWGVVAGEFGDDIEAGGVIEDGIFAEGCLEGWLFFGEEFSEIEAEERDEYKSGEQEEEVDGDGAVEAEGGVIGECIDDGGVLVIFAGVGVWCNGELGEWRRGVGVIRQRGDGSDTTFFEPRGLWRCVVGFRPGHWGS